MFVLRKASPGAFLVRLSSITNVIPDYFLTCKTASQTTRLCKLDATGPNTRLVLVAFLVINISEVNWHLRTVNIYTNRFWGGLSFSTSSFIYICFLFDFSFVSFVCFSGWVKSSSSNGRGKRAERTEAVWQLTFTYKRIIYKMFDPPRPLRRHYQTVEITFAWKEMQIRRCVPNKQINRLAHVLESCPDKKSLHYLFRSKRHESES